jgi:cytoskeletal protein RodZ
MTGRMPDHEPQPQGGASELASFGEELRREREIRGISLKEIADATKISRRFLEAIERNDHRTLPAPVFTRGFVREYARYVGLAAEDMVNRYNFAAARDDRIEKPVLPLEKYPNAAPPRDITPKPKPKRGIPPVYARVDRNVIALILIVAALGGVAWWAVQHKRGDTEPAAEVAAVVPEATASAAPAPAPSDAAPADDSMLRMSVAVSDNAWVTLEADGETVLNAEMMRGDRRDFEARDRFRFRTIGNAAGVTLTLNGVEVPPLGENGEVVKNRVFDRQSLQELRAAPPQNQP